MNEEYLLGAYNSFGGQEKLKVDFNTWVSKIKDNEDYKKGMYDNFGGEQTLKASYDDWNGKVFGLKKKETTQSLLEKPKSDSSTEKKSTSLDSEGIISEEDLFGKIESKDESFLEIKNESPENILQAKENLNQTEQQIENFDESEIFSKYKELSNLNEDEDSAIKNEILEDSENKGVWNTIKQGAKNLWNLGNIGNPLNQISTDNLIDSKKEAVKEFRAKKIEFTQEQLNKRAFEIEYDKRKSSIIETKQRNFMKDISDREKSILIADSGLKEELLSKRDKDYNLIISLHKKNITKKEKRLQEIQNIADKFKENNSTLEDGMSENDKLSLVSEFETLSKELEVDKIEALNTYQKFTNGKEDLYDTQTNLDVFKRDYGFFKNIAGNVGAGAGTFYAGLAGSVAYLNDFTVGNETVSNFALKKQKDFQKGSENISNNIMQPIKVDGINGLRDLGSFTANTFATQTQNLVASSTGVGGIVALGFSGTGNKYAEMQEEGGYSTLKNFAIPLAFGTGEAIGGIVNLSVLKNTAKILKSATDVERRLMSKGMFDGLVKFSKDTGSNFLKEYGEEQGVDLMQKFLDQQFLGKEVDYFADMKDIAGSTAVISLLLPLGANIVKQSVKPFNKEGNLDKYLEELQRLENEIKNPFINDKTKSILQKNLTKTQGKLKIEFKKIGETIDGLDKNQYNEILSLEKEKKNIIEDIKSIREDKGLDKKNKEIVENTFKEDFDKLNQKQISILESYKNNEKTNTQNLEDKKEPIKSTVTQQTKEFTDALGKTEDLSEIGQGLSKVSVDGADVIFKSNEDKIVLESIEAKEKGKGNAKKALKKITDLADEKGTEIELTVSPKEGTDKDRLVKLYEDNGFESTSGDKMVRKPKVDDSFQGIDEVIETTKKESEPQIKTDFTDAEPTIGKNVLDNEVEGKKTDIEKRRRESLGKRQGRVDPKLSSSPKSKSSNEILERKAQETEKEISKLREEDGSITKENLPKFKELQKKIRKLRKGESESKEDILKRLQGKNISDILFSTFSGSSTLKDNEQIILTELLLKEGFTQEEINYLFKDKDNIQQIKERFFEVSKTKINAKYDVELTALDNETKTKGDTSTDKNIQPTTKSKSNTKSVKIEADKKEQVSVKTREKSVFKRVYDGDTSKELKDVVEANGLNYEIESREKAKASAKKFVKEVGITKALGVLRGNKLIKGAERAFVYAEILEVLTETSENASLEELSKIQEDYSDALDEALVAFEEESRDAGRFIGALTDIYNTSKIKYSYKKQVEKYKANNKGVVDEDILRKFKEADENIKRLEQKLKEASENQLKEENDKAIEDIKESNDRDNFKSDSESIYTQKELDNALLEAKKEWESENLGFKIPKIKTERKKSEILKQIEEVKNKWKKASKGDTLNSSIPYAKQLLNATPEIIKLAKLYAEMGGLKTIEIVDNIKEVFKNIKESDLKSILKKEFKKGGKKVITEEAKRKIYISLLNRKRDFINEQIENKERVRIERFDKYKDDAEINNLREENKRLEDVLEKIDPKYSQSRRLQENLNKVQKSLDEYQRKIDEQDFDKKNKEEKKIIDVNLRNLRRQRDLKKRVFEKAKNKYHNSLISDEAILERKIINREKVLEKRLKDLKKNKPTNSKTNNIWSSKISELQNEIYEIKDSRKKIKSTNSNRNNITLSDDGAIKIPEKIIRELVSNGFDDINKLTKKVIEIIKEDNPNFNLSEREVRDSITKYGREQNPTKNDLQGKINELRNTGRLITELEDLLNGKKKKKLFINKRQLTQTEEDLTRKINHELSKIPDSDLEIDNKLKQKIKTIAKQIEKLKERIVDGKIEYEKKPTPITNSKIEELLKEKKKLQKEIENLREDYGIKEKRRLEQSKKRIKKQIEDYKKRLISKDFSKKEKKPLQTDEEYTSILAEKIKWQEVYEKEQYALELKNRGWKVKAREALVGLINIPRILSAGGEMSMVLIQGGIQTISLATRNPKALINILGKSFRAVGSQEIMDKYSSNLKANVNYPLFKQVKLGLTESDYKMESREEDFIGNNLVYGIWNLIGKGIEYGSVKITGVKDIKSLGGTLIPLIKKDYAGTKKSISERFKNANPMLAFERGNTLYMNEIRRLRFEDGMKMIKKEGKNELDHIDDYKKLASAINTMTGRASIGRAESLNDIISTVFFSFKNTVSVFNQLNPYFYLSLHSPNDPLTKASVAQKLAVRDMLTFLGVTTSMMMLLQASAGQDDDGEDVIQIEFDPRSSDFMQIKIKGKEKDIRFDPWHGMRTNVVFFARLWDGHKKNDKGKIKRIGKGYNSPTQWDNYMTTFVENKFSPAMGMVFKGMDSNVKGNGENEIKQRYGKETFEDIEKSFYPMFIDAMIEIEGEDPELLVRTLSVFSLFGLNASVR